MKKAIFTICSKNYLGQASVLMKSVGLHEPDVDRYIVIVDKRSDVDLDSGLAQLIWVEDINIPEFQVKAFIFDVLELNTNVKPTVLKMLLRRYEQCVYLDPDTLLYRSLLPVWDHLAQNNVGLTPHVLSAPNLNDPPWDQDLLRYGVYNLGFIAVRAGEDASLFLDWWESSCLGHGFHAPSDGFFVDQKFVDLAPVFFSGVRPIMSPALNVGYWNLHERAVSGTPGEWLVNAVPLVFMHFSGFIYEPHEGNACHISKYTDKVDLRCDASLSALVDDYRIKLHDANHGTYRKYPYSFGNFEDGTPINRLARRLVAINGVGTDIGDPFAVAGPVFKLLAEKGVIRPGSGRKPASDSAESKIKKVRSVEPLFRWLLKRIGPDRYLAMMKLFGHMSSTLNQRFLVE